ncbi:hypothetical protein FRAHR75_420040 [Frankia sp. Hr75.2]|nr:hypothetical protein FRAHR75_420040 [Frankia sp. Hr75.2]SQD98465.1 hypothetical protein FMEAI12_4660017 [Parafrankia sp. Ea1.12]
MTTLRAMCTACLSRVPIVDLRHGPAAEALVLLVLGYSPLGFFLAISGGIFCGIRPERARRMSEGEQATLTFRRFIRYRA